MKQEKMFFKNGKPAKELRNDDILPIVSIKPLKELTGLDSKKGYDNAIISNGKIVNICSNSYGLLPNEQFFIKVEEKLIEADIHYLSRSINRNDCNFAVDYILDSEQHEVIVANGKDKIKPILRFINSYDGSCKTSGSFGYFREVCSNGLHIAESKLDFNVKHKGSICEVVLPHIDELVNNFLSNEYYTLKSKAERLSNVVIDRANINGIIEKVCKDTGIFQYQLNTKNKPVSSYADTVINTVLTEANMLGTDPNLWLLYNSFNELLYSDTFKKTFTMERELDNKLFNSVMEMAN
jgi:hypothetical protein